MLHPSGMEPSSVVYRIGPEGRSYKIWGGRELYSFFDHLPNPRRAVKGHHSLDNGID